jgi:hypothetical protein
LTSVHFPFVQVDSALGSQQLCPQPPQLEESVWTSTQLRKQAVSGAVQTGAQ